MAATLAPLTAITFAMEYIQKLPLNRVEIRTRILDDAAKWLWMAAPWPWTVGTLTPTTLTADQDEIEISGGVPADFLKLVWAGTTTSEQPQDLVIVPALPDGNVLKGQPKRITSRTVAANTFRLFPIPTSHPSPPYLLAVYKKAHTEITAANESTGGVLVMDDEWFYVYDQIVLYYAYLYAEDPRAAAQLQAIQGFFIPGMLASERPLLSLYGEVQNG